jgi:hypothetical protein
MGLLHMVISFFENVISINKFVMPGLGQRVLGYWSNGIEGKEEL